MYIVLPVYCTAILYTLVYVHILYCLYLYCITEPSCRFLISRGADKNALTDEGERPIDLVDPEDKVGQRLLLTHDKVSRGCFSPMIR